MYSEQFCFKSTEEQRLLLGDGTHLTVDELLTQPYAVFSDINDQQLEALAQRASLITRQRFGHVMRFFVPLYLSNECYNNCTYCGFSYDRDIDRYTLSDAEIVENVQILVNKGFQHILLLTGEAAKTVEMTYFERVLPLIRPYVAQLGMEVQPLEESDYRQLIELGLDAVTVYQETYHKDHYLMHHLSGKKRRFEYRLDTADRAARAGVYRINIGALLGLSDWRFDAIALVGHLRYLYKTYWQTQFSISFPRITSIFDGTQPLQTVSDRQLVQLVCAFRCLFPDLGITLSTRESQKLRDGLLHLGVTDMSAESMTSPGAYSGIDAEPQFSTTDHRSLDDIQALLTQKGVDSVVKDWDRTYTQLVS
ncbi:2-iminoacetate synthase ThiH [Candidatus Marinamargulisbacteria bacterium SCGC AG-343-K17]|nr:2-iminoacetate synthase ThiH [Candidatus Marinamargulisbacteria bacterium SCGC AG-343-K17]